MLPESQLKMCVCVINYTTSLCQYSVVITGQIQIYYYKVL